MNQQKSSFILERFNLNHPAKQQNGQQQMIILLQQFIDDDKQSKSSAIISHKLSQSIVVISLLNVFIYQADILNTLTRTSVHSQLKLEQKLLKIIYLLYQEGLIKTFISELEQSKKAIRQYVIDKIQKGSFEQQQPRQKNQRQAKQNKDNQANRKILLLFLGLRTVLCFTIKRASQSIK